MADEIKGCRRKSLSFSLTEVLFLIPLTPPHRKLVYGGGSVTCLKLEKSAKYIVLARMDLSYLFPPVPQM